MCYVTVTLMTLVERPSNRSRIVVVATDRVTASERWYRVIDCCRVGGGGGPRADGRVRGGRQPGTAQENSVGSFVCQRRPVHPAAARYGRSRRRSQCRAGRHDRPRVPQHEVRLRHGHPPTVQPRQRHRQKGSRTSRRPSLYGGTYDEPHRIVSASVVSCFDALMSKSNVNSFSIYNNLWACGNPVNTALNTYFSTLYSSQNVSDYVVVTLRAKLSGAVYYNRSCLCVCLCVYCVCVCLWICLCVYGSVTTITRNCMHRSSPNWVYR